MPETTLEKSARLVASGRVTIRRVETNLISAAVRGDSAHVYITGWDPAGWFCSCPAQRRCSHIRAVQLVVLEPLPTTGTGPKGVST